MSDLFSSSNPFILIVEASQILNAMSHSDQLKTLRSKRLRPLDNKNTPAQKKVKPASKNANNYNMVHAANKSLNLISEQR